MYSEEVLADTPSLYWRLNELTPGTGTAADSSGNGNNGTYVASPPSVNGLLRTEPDRAVMFGLTGSWITSSYNPFQTSVNRSFECWALRQDTTTNDVMWGGAQPSTQPFLTINSATNSVAFFTTAASSGQTWASSFLPSVPNHVVLTWTGSTKTSELYVNGVSFGTKVHATDFDATPGNFNAGKRSTASDPYLGVLDEIAVYTSVLSASRIQAHYWAGANPVGFRPYRMPLGV